MTSYVILSLLAYADIKTNDIYLLLRSNGHIYLSKNQIQFWPVSGSVSFELNGAMGWPVSAIIPHKQHIVYI